jgi:phosphoserine aminotransferase
MATVPIKPKRPNFSSGPTVKFDGWSLNEVDTTLLGRSHRSMEGVDAIHGVLQKIKTLLNVPHDYSIAMVPGSTTGAIEMLMWNLLGPRCVDIFSFDVFGKRWLHTIESQLKINHRSFESDYGYVPDLNQYDPSHDALITWNGTTSGAMICDYESLTRPRDGLVITDVTSIAFCAPLPFELMDAAAFSFQKGLGGEAAHGIIIMSPKAMHRLQTYTPIWPMPYLFTMKKNDIIVDGLFKGQTLNTPSMLCVMEMDYILNWANTHDLIQKTNANFEWMWNWASFSPYFKPMSMDKDWASRTSFTFQRRNSLPNEMDERQMLRDISLHLKSNSIALDCLNHQTAPPSLRIWTGPTIELQDLHALTNYLDHYCK